MNFFINLLNKKYPFYVIAVAAILSGTGVYFLFPKPPEKIVFSSPVTDCTYRMNQLRLMDFKLTHPLLLSDLPSENPELNSVKEKINQVISAGKTSGILTGASVYFRNLNDGSWFEINGSNVFNPASLMKVPLMISILRQSITNPSFLDKKIFFEKHFPGNYDQNIKDFRLQENKYYSIRELLKFMISYSDNDAMSLIVQNIDENVYNKLFSDLGIQAPPPLFSTKGVEYFMNIMNYSKFFRILYNSAYLSDDYSEFGLELLTKSTYKDGFLKKINPGIQVAHKFGERILNTERQLHEVGIFYSGNKPYLLGVMTSGKDLGQLSNVLGDISEVVFTETNKTN
ncbi:MAG: class A beta-lactamase-related serine hydrolase [Bacteroidetes bacterium]|nr:class A beta-lactamase-related serine hydrolase [Bacteroidota bacterium]